MTTSPEHLTSSALPRQTCSLQFLCPRCEEMFLCDAEFLSAIGAQFSCPHCQLVLDGRAGSLRLGEPVEQCLVCGNHEFYIQKDFNRELGLMIVLGSALVVFLSMLVIHHLFGVICLLLVALVDWMVYRQLANVTVCYLCQSIYRGFPLHPAHVGFYLGHEEKYKKLRQAWLKSRVGES